MLKSKKKKKQLLRGFYTPVGLADFDFFFLRPLSFFVFFSKKKNKNRKAGKKVPCYPLTGVGSALTVEKCGKEF